MEALNFGSKMNGLILKNLLFIILGEAEITAFAFDQ